MSEVPLYLVSPACWARVRFRCKVAGFSPGSRGVSLKIQSYLAHQKLPPPRTLCLGPRGGPRGGADSYERGTHVVLFAAATSVAIHPRKVCFKALFVLANLLSRALIFVY